MSNELASDQEITVDLKNPALAGVLAWLIPGLGHFYQGRIAKGIVFSVCILSTFFYGVYLGGSSELGWGRVVYASWRPGHRRLHYLAQIGVGLPALPALLEAKRAADGNKPLFGGFMAPPRPVGDPNAGRREIALEDQPTLDTMHRQLKRYFDIGSAYTMIAGLLNVLAIYDACCGPVIAENRKDEEEEPAKEPARDSAAKG